MSVFIRPSKLKISLKIQVLLYLHKCFNRDVMNENSSRNKSILIVKILKMCIVESKMLNGEFRKSVILVHAKEKTLNIDLKQFLKTHMPNLCLNILTTTSYGKKYNVSIYCGVPWCNG